MLARNTEDLPGVSGTARVDRNTTKLLRKLKEGDIAVLDAEDLDRATAQELVDKGVVAVVNASASITGRFPNQGPEVIVAAGLPLIDSVGDDVFRKVRNGARLRVHEGKLFLKGRRVAVGEEQSEDEVADRIVEARTGLVDHLEAFSGNTVEFIRSESTLIVDGYGIPDVSVDIAGRPVVVVTEGEDSAASLKGLKHFIKEYRPVLVGVGPGADVLHDAGYLVDIIVGDPDEIGDEVLRGGAELVLPAEPDGHAPGLERLQDLGIGAITFPAAATPADMALLLVDHHGAELVVVVNATLTIDEFFDPSHRDSNPSNFLTRLKLGPRLVDADAVASLYRSRVSGVAVAIVVLAILIALIGVLLVVGNDSAIVRSLIDAWNAFARWVQGLFG